MKCPLTLRKTLACIFLCLQQIHVVHTSMCFRFPLNPYQLQFFLDSSQFVYIAFIMKSRNKMWTLCVIVCVCYIISTCAQKCKSDRNHQHYAGRCFISSVQDLFGMLLWINTLSSILAQLLHYILKCNYFGMKTVSSFVKIISIPDEDSFRNVRRLNSLVLCLNYMTPSPSFEAVYCYICGRRRMVVARHRMIFLFLLYLSSNNFEITIEFRKIKTSCLAIKCNYIFKGFAKLKIAFV